MPHHAWLFRAGRCDCAAAGIWVSAGTPRGGNCLKTAILQQPYREEQKLNQFDTIKAEAEDEFVEKRSRFLCAIAPVRSPEEAAAFLTRRREQHYDARHTVYAYILREGNREKYSDDGEPQGTGGQPVLEVHSARRGRTDPRLCQRRGARRRGGGTDHLPLLRRLPDRDGLSAVRTGEQAAARL